MGRHVKKNEFKVRLSDEQAAVLLELLRLERDERQDADIGGATLLREHAMPGIRARLAALKRAGPRQQPVGAGFR